MDNIDSDGFRANVGIIVTGKPGKVLLGGRTGNRGWQFPQGGIRVDENSDEAMFRELEEEIGLTPADVEVMGQTKNWLRYRLPDRYVRKNSRPLCIGQKQIWYLLKLVVTDSRLRLDHSEKPEFDRWRWVDYWSPAREVIYFKREVYMQALDQLAPVLFPGGAPPRPEWWSRQWDRKSRG